MLLRGCFFLSKGKTSPEWISYPEIPASTRYNVKPTPSIVSKTSESVDSGTILYYIKETR